MPLFQAMAERANIIFNRENVAKIDPKVFDAPFDQIARQLGVAKSDAEREFLASFPLSIQEAVRAVVRSAVSRAHPLPITFAWAPGYDFELLVSESRTVQNSIGGITLFMRTRYPGDRGYMAE